MTVNSQRFCGVHAATVCPMRPDFSIDETALARHVTSVSKTSGIDGLLVNGHAGENFLLTREELRRVIAVVRSAVPDNCWVTAGVNAESSLEAACLAADAQAAGADALLVFPPNSWGLQHDAEMVVLHHRQVMDASTLPLMLYQAPVGAGRMAYTLAEIEKLIAFDRVAAIKEGSWEVAAYEQNYRFVKQRRPDIAVLGSGDEHLLPCYVIGSDGAQVSLAAVVPELIANLHQAVSSGDWLRAREVHEKIYPLSVAIYRAQPGNRATARLKMCLKILGRLECDAVRPPIVAAAEEYLTLEKALKTAL
jgi:4-hydroxy-tetrahydrodipicolinate synthase